MIKLFRSFIDLSPNYYTTTQEDDMELTSIQEAGDTMTDILRQCVKHQSVLHRLIVEDTFFMIVRILSAKPVDDVPQDKDPAYMMWKEK